MNNQDRMFKVSVLIETRDSSHLGICLKSCSPAVQILSTVNNNVRQS